MNTEIKNKKQLDDFLWECSKKQGAVSIKKDGIAVAWKCIQTGKQMEVGQQKVNVNSGLKLN